MNLEEITEGKATVYATAIQNRFAFIESVENERSNGLWQETKAVLIEETSFSLILRNKWKDKPG